MKTTHANQMAVIKLNKLASTAALAVAMMSPAANAFVIGTTTYNPAIGNPPIFTSAPTVGISIADVGETFNIGWLLTAADSGAGADIGGNATFTVNSFDSTTLELIVDVANTTAPSFQAALMSIGIGTDPNTVGSMVTPGTVFLGVEAGNGPNQTYPGGFKNIDACAFASGCNGSSISDGLAAGDSDLFTIALTGSFGTSPFVTLSHFAVKFQTEDGSFEFPGSSGNGDIPSSAPLPEPGMVSLLGIGLLGQAWILHQRRRRKPQ